MEAGVLTNPASQKSGRPSRRKRLVFATGGFVPNFGPLRGGLRCNPQRRTHVRTLPFDASACQSHAPNSRMKRRPKRSSTDDNRSAEAATAILQVKVWLIAALEDKIVQRAVIQPDPGPVSSQMGLAGELSEVAPDYAARRSTLAKNTGLAPEVGRGVRQAAGSAGQHVPRACGAGERRTSLAWAEEAGGVGIVPLPRFGHLPHDNVRCRR